MKLTSEKKSGEIGGSASMSENEEADLRDRFDEVVTALFDRMGINDDQRVDKTEFIE